MEDHLLLLVTITHHQVHMIQVMRSEVKVTDDTFQQRAFSMDRRRRSSSFNRWNIV